MALRPCRECGREISTEAATCPQCGVPRPTQPETAPTSAEHVVEPRLKGLEGWLLLFGIALVLGALVSLLQLAVADDGFTRVLSGLDLVVAAWLLYAFFTTRRYFPRAAIILFIAVPIFALIGWILEPTNFREFFGGLLRAAIWVPYLRWSKRVRNTFVN